MSWPRTKKKLSIVAYCVITVAAFFFTAQAGRSLGYWQSETPDEMYRVFYNGIIEISHP